MVSVSDCKARGPRFEAGNGIRNPNGDSEFSDEMCKYLQLMSCSFAEIMCLFVVSVCIN